MPFFAFALVLGVVAAGAAATGSGIRGRVTASPTCPVETMPPQPGCAPRGFKARIRVVRLSDRRVVASFLSHDDGRFSVRLRPGRYSVRARSASGGSLPRCPDSQRATVRRDAYTRMAIDCDSGIR